MVEEIRRSRVYLKGNGQKRLGSRHADQSGRLVQGGAIDPTGSRQ